MLKRCLKDINLHICYPTLTRFNSQRRVAMSLPMNSIESVQVSMILNSATTLIVV
uniref:Uncharacterized protein n=1 Tax=Anguilla anguilla TaxID=7936 RepID=A0A0E9QLH8_ANGAN